MLTLSSLLSKGFFPKELPPPFLTSEFASLVNRQILINPAFDFDFSHFTSSKYSSYNLARAGGIRRKLGIPNPIFHFKLCQFIVENWPAIKTHLRKSPLSVSMPLDDLTTGRAVGSAFKPDEIYLKQTHDQVGKKYLVTADIAKFYPSIYTHSIPWAFHTKAVAKKRCTDSSLLGNLIDKWVRLSQDKQTMGIPVGPDTSWIIAESVLAPVDEALQMKLGTLKGGRWIDDYKLYFDSLAECEKAVSILQEILNEFELSLNETKTKIDKLPQPIDEPWVVELRFLEIGGPEKEGRQAADIKHLFEKAFIFARTFSEKSVLAYSISKLNDVRIHPDNWDLVENLLLHCILVEPRTVSFVLPILVNSKEQGHNITKANIKEVMNKLIGYHAPLGHGDEVTWGIWGLIEFEEKVSFQNAKLLSETQDSIVALLALDANERGLIPDELNTSFWEVSLELNDLYGKNWLLAYEGAFKGWILFPDVLAKLNDDPNWGLLRRGGCSFYDSSAGTVWVSHGEYF